jgi:hypothetical protein
MAITSTDVIAGADTLASDYNTLRAEVIGALVPTGTTRYYAISPASVVPSIETYTWEINQSSAKSGDTGTVAFYCGVNLPHSAIITSFKVNWFRNDAAASGQADLRRGDPSDGSQIIMASADSDSSAGFHSVTDSSISSATIDNENYTYGFFCFLSPNDSQDDVVFVGSVVTYTIEASLP